MGIERFVQGPRSFARGLTRPFGGGRKEKTAFVLSGGGVLGAIQVGQIEALFDAGIFPDLLCAASVGAINAAGIAAEPTMAGIDRMKQSWASLRTEDIFPGTRMQRAWHFVAKGDHLYANSGIRRLADMVPVHSIEHMTIPLSINAANLRTGKEHWFSSGALAPAILASTALPGIFPPVMVDGELYVDGGVVNNVPVSRAVELGATKIYVLTCGAAKPAARPIRRPLDVLMQAVTQSRAAAVELDIARYAQKAEIVVLPVPDTGPVRFTDPTKSAHLMKLGYDAARDYLAGESITVGAVSAL